MESFYKSLKAVKDDIFKLKENYVMSNSIKHKQLLMYYIYRIICKYNNVIKLNTNPAAFDDVFETIEIPSDMTDKCYPLCHKLSNNETKLDNMINKGMFLFENLRNNLKSNNMLGKKKQIEYFKDFIESKFNIETIKEDLVLLNSLLPKLSKSRVRPGTNI
jgi:hypothetical protein